MKSFEDALAFVKWREGAIDGRDLGRFSLFVPFDRLSDAGLEPKDGMTAEDWGEVRPWTEEEVLKQLKEDAEFGLEKAKNDRGISAWFMFEVVCMWCQLLENGLEQVDSETEYVAFFEGILKHYGWR